jgi:hypothetical protein
LRGFEAELEEKDRKVASQQTEIEMFDRVLEVRVKQATQDALARCALLENAVRANKDVDYALGVHTQSILEFMDGVRLADGEPMGAARAVLTRIRRRLTAHLSLINHQVGEDEIEPTGQPRA